MTGTVATFYSYKGGVGRTFALANVGVTLSQWGFRTLCVDWDLDAPGLPFYFDRWAPTLEGGLVDLVAEVADGREADPTRFTVTVDAPATEGRLDFLPAGVGDESYVRRAQEIDWSDLYREHDFGAVLETWRDRWINEYDFVLVDSRTGITDMGGICTAQIPDVLVAMFTASEQSLRGVLDVIARAENARDRLPYDRFRLLTLPVPARFDASEEHQRADQWWARFVRDFEPLIGNWVINGVDVPKLLELLTIPYVSYWSFGEDLPAVEKFDPTAVRMVGYALQTLAATVAHRLDHSDLLTDSRDSFVRSASAGAGVMLSKRAITAPTDSSATDSPHRIPVAVRGTDGVRTGLTYPGYPRRRRSRRVGFNIAVASFILAIVASTTIVAQPWSSMSQSSQQLGNCQQIDISTALEGGSYYRYGQALRDLIQRDFPGSAVMVESTAGSAANLDRLDDPSTAQCRLAIAQLNVAVDASNGVYQFAGNPNERLRTVGPLGSDILQLVVRADSPVTSATDLCGRTVATPPQGSGTEQLAAVLFRQVEKQILGCQVGQQPREIPSAVADLRAGEVDAIAFASGTANRETRDAHTTGTPIRLIPTDGYLDAVQDDWDAYYRSRLGPAFVPGDIFYVETIGPMDYPGLAPTRTIAVPNGVVVNETADPDLVRFVADKLFSDRAAFEQALWDGMDVGRPLPDARRMLTTSPLYCMVKLHAAAAAYYQTVGIQPPCDK